PKRFVQQDFGMQTKTAVSRAKAYLKVRQKSVRTAMKSLKLDALLLTHAPDLAYLSNFTGDDSVGLITDKDVHLITDFRYQEQAELEAAWMKLTVREGPMAPAVAGTIQKAKIRRIGFEANFTTVGQIDALERALKEADAKDVELIPLEDVMTKIRMVKDDHEIDLI